MLKKVLLLLLAGLLLLGGWMGYIFYQQYQDHRYRVAARADMVESVSPTVTVLRDTFPLGYRDERKDLHIYLPPNYATDTLTRFPVIYLLDGSGAFSSTENEAPEWEVDEVIDRTVAAGGPGAIVIGVNSAPDRDAEYTPWPTEDVPHAHGERFGQWLAEELKPWVDATYRTRPEPAATVIGGISRSGMMAYYLTMARPETFGNALIQSPSMWVDRERLLDLAAPNTDLSGKRLFISVGEREGKMVDMAEEVHARLSALGPAPDRLRYELLEDMRHWHPTWRESFARAYPWIIGG